MRQDPAVGREADVLLKRLMDLTDPQRRFTAGEIVRRFPFNRPGPSLLERQMSARRDCALEMIAAFGGKKVLGK